MLSWLSMIGTYGQRNVDNFKNEVFTVDTSAVCDRDYIYEVAVAHKEFNDGDWIILEGVYTKEEAQKAHDKWVEYFLKNDYTEIYDIYENETYKKGE
jgi:hypothetical protein